jgi:hypothetical protein
MLTGLNLKADEIGLNQCAAFSSIRNVNKALRLIATGLYQKAASAGLISVRLYGNVLKLM